MNCLSALFRDPEQVWPNTVITHLKGLVHRVGYCGNRLQVRASSVSETSLTELKPLAQSYLTLLCEMEKSVSWSSGSKYSEIPEILQNLLSETDPWSVRHWKYLKQFIKVGISAGQSIHNSSMVLTESIQENLNEIVCNPNSSIFINRIIFVFTLYFAFSLQVNYTFYLTYSNCRQSFYKCRYFF